MGKNLPPPEDEGPPGAPKWMVTFSDCMTLLLTFFVLLLTFSSFDDKSFRKMSTSLAQAMPSIGQQARRRDAVQAPSPVEYQPDRQKGSEKATQDQTTVGNMNEGQSHLDFEQRKVYRVPSKAMFLGMGAELSAEGKELLTDLATIVRTMPNHIVISEHRQPASPGVDPLGMRRAWTATHYLTGVEKLDKYRFAIAGNATVPTENLPSDGQTLQIERVLEISLLERSISQ
ncbi:flagellar motor protein MotB [Planctomycetota bacterium]